MCLVNVTDPKPAGWKKIEEFGERGGGVAIFLGDRVNAAAYHSAAAGNVLPGKLVGSLTFTPPQFLDLQNLTHPIFKKFADWDASVLTGVEIHGYWSVDASEGAGVLAHYTDFRHRPSFIEKAVGKGRVLMMTTSVDRRWNDLPAAVNWGFVALADQMMRYLSNASQAVYNHTAGEEVLLALDPTERIPAYTPALNPVSSSFATISRRGRRPSWFRMSISLAIIGSAESRPMRNSIAASA